MSSEKKKDLFHILYYPFKAHVKLLTLWRLLVVFLLMVWIRFSFRRAYQKRRQK